MEQIFIIIAQRATKLWPVKVRGLKRILPLGQLEYGPGSLSGFYSDHQLWHVTVLQSSQIWWWIVAHLKAPSHIYMYLTWKTEKQYVIFIRSTFILYHKLQKSPVFLLATVPYWLTSLIDWIPMIQHSIQKTPSKN